MSAPCSCSPTASAKSLQHHRCLQVKDEGLELLQMTLVAFWILKKKNYIYIYIVYVCSIDIVPLWGHYFSHELVTKYKYATVFVFLS